MTKDKWGCGNIRGELSFHVTNDTKPFQLLDIQNIIVNT